MADNEKTIWTYLKNAGFNDYAVAGIMGNLYAESGLSAKNLQNLFNTRLNMTDDQYVSAVDNGSYKNFIKDSAGFGLAQWTFWSRKQGLYNLCKSKHKSIGDLDTQLEYLVKELKTYKALYQKLMTVTSVKAASDAILVDFEKPADQSDVMKAKRATYGQQYFNKYHKVEPASATNIDSTPNSWAADSVNWAIQNKILLGDENGNLMLHKYITREEALVFLYRAIKR